MNPCSLDDLVDAACRNSRMGPALLDAYAAQLCSTNQELFPSHEDGLRGARENIRLFVASTLGRRQAMVVTRYYELGWLPGEKASKPQRDKAPIQSIMDWKRR